MAKNKRKHETAFKIFSPLARLIFKIYYNPKIINKDAIPKEGPILIVCNHKHVFDQCFAIMATKRPIRYMAKKEYFDGKNAWFFRLAGCIPVDRSIHDDAAKAAALEVLELDGAVGLFPEGTRNKTNDKFLLDFKFGTVSMAQKTGATIIPCSLTGDYCFRSKNLMFRVGKPFKVEKDEDLSKANKKLYKEIENLMKKSLKETNRTIEEELNSRCQDTKKK
ncbi:MAG: lysophospholipid acyltransferase family protein [Candidatus Coprovivens sp.]